MRPATMRAVSAAVALIATVATFANAQDVQQSGDSLKPDKPARIFTADRPLAFTLVANYGRLKHERKGTPTYHWAEIRYTDSAGAPVALPIQVRTRGIWRRNNCELPPLRLHFAKENEKHTQFAKLKNAKLVMHCRDADEYEQYLLMEYQLYRVYNVLSPMSHLVRLARVTYQDSASGKPVATRYAFLLEDLDAMAGRLAATVTKLKGANPGDLNEESDAFIGVFQYLIGNTDWSISALHNVEVLQKNFEYYGIVHDFDFSGAVNARYATVDPRLPIHFVRDRVYRGYCVADSVFPKVFAIFDQKKPAIYALYSDSIGALLTHDNVKSTLEYFDDFYRVIDNPKKAKSEIIEGCLGRR